MAKYTVELHDLLINEETNKLIKKAMSSYPMYEPIHKELYGYIPTREQLNKKILDHYRFYEIGAETPGRFFFYLETALNEIMPKYNQLYKSVDIMNGVEDIFGNLDVEESFIQESIDNSSSKLNGNVKGSILENNEGTSTNKTTGSNTADVTSQNTTDTNMNTNGRNVNQKTPQSQLQVKTIDKITAASEITWNEDSSNSKSTSNDKSKTLSTNEYNSTATNKSNSTNTSNQETNSDSTSESKGKISHTLKRKGNQGVNTYAHDMLEFRQLFLNIEQQIINDPELVNCFMLIW